MTPVPRILLAGLWESVFSGFVPALLVLIGILALVFGAVSVYQTRRWPKTEPKPKPKEAPKPKAAPKAEPAAPGPEEPVALRPTTTTRTVQIRYPGIDEAHPDVWSTGEPLDVLVQVDPKRHGPDTALSVRLSVHRGGKTELVGTVGVDERGEGTFRVPFHELGEQDLIAELLADDRPAGQAVRSIRIVDYRSEMVETFEDFLAWAASHYTFVNRKMTAREFVDRYADGRPGTPVAPLERIVDLYELANYSDHPIDRRAYLDLVDAFLQLEEAGALEGPEAH